VLLTLPVALAVVLAVFPLHNDDAGFHIASGRWILATGHVPATNPFTYAHDGATWVQHQWLPAVAIAWLVDHGGIPLLIGVKAALVGLAFALMALSLARTRLPTAASVLLLTVAVTACAFRFYERPYLTSILALAGTILALQAWQSTQSRTARNLAIALPVLAIHLHAGGLDSVLVWLAFTAGHLLQPVVRPEEVVPRRAVALACLTMLGLLVATLALLAPSGLGVLTLPFSFAGNAYWHEHLAEFRPLALSASLQWPLVAVAAVGLLVAVGQRRVFETLALLGYLALALRHVRMVWPMAVVAVPLAGAMLARVWPERLRSRPVAALLLAVALLIGQRGVVDQDELFGLGLPADGIDHLRHPLELLDRAAALPEHAFVSDGFAGTWLWREFQPPDPRHPEGQHAVLVHNCLECYQEATYRDVYQRIRYGQAGWRELVARYGIRTFLLKYSTPGERAFQQGLPNIRQQLYADAAYVLVDFDDAASLFTARATLPTGTPVLDGFPLDPDTGRERPGATEAAIREALLEHAHRHPRGIRALDMLTRRELARGHRPEAMAALAEMVRRQPSSPATRGLLERVRR
jgi:hypothetical protein